MSIYRAALGDSWNDLPAVLQRMHGAGLMVGSGMFRVRNGTGLVTAIVRRLMKLPHSSEATRVTLRIEPCGSNERWVRTFGDDELTSMHQVQGAGTVAERVGPAEILFRLALDDGRLLIDQMGVSLVLGPWRVPVPRRLAPAVHAVETAAGADLVHVSVTVAVPGCRPIVEYEGALRIEEAAGDSST